MIPAKVQRLFNFIEYLDQHKSEYMQYIPICNELIELNIQRNKLNPNENYQDKFCYDVIQKAISEKIELITEYIQKPIKNKLLELEIWSGDVVYSSIWNNNYDAISEFKNNFTTEDVIQVMKYKKWYLDFRNETNTDFVLLIYVFDGLDKILKVLFDFFKDTSKNEFESFEIRALNVTTIKEAVEHALASGKSISFSLPNEAFVQKEKAIHLNDQISVYNKIVMGDNTEIGNISNNSGQIIVGKNIKTEVNVKDELAEKSFNWQKWLGIVGTILAILGIVATVVMA